MRFALGLLVAAALVGCGGGDEEAAPPTPTQPAGGMAPLTVELAEVDASGESGTATLTPGGTESFQVAIDYDPNDPSASRQVHIHEGACGTEKPSVVTQLEDVFEGESTTEVSPGNLADLTDGAHSIDVHAPDPPRAVVACGEIPKR